MSIDLRADAPDQTDIIDPKKLSEEVEKLKTIQNSTVYMILCNEETEREHDIEILKDRII